MTPLRTILATSLLFAASLAAAFDVSAKSAIIVDAESGKVLWEKEAFAPRHPASTTKIMTSLLLLEHTQPADWIVAPKGVDKVEPSSMHLRVGEKVSARGMLYALMLRSANDGCVAVAHHISGSVAAFAKLMNERAREIGCLNTNFANPNGLTHPKHLTTAYDLSLMAREAMKLEDFRTAAKTQKKTIARSINHKDQVMQTHNKWLAKDLSADGIKTGYTRAAGKCYVGSATREGYRIITVILKSEDWQVDHQRMLNWAYDNHAKELVAAANAEIGKLTLPNSEPAEIPLVVRSEVHRIARRDGSDPLKIDIQYLPNLEAPIQEGQELGTVSFSDSSGWKQTLPVFAGASSETDPFVLATLGGKAGFGILTLAMLGGLAGYSRSRRSRVHAKAIPSSSY